MSSKEAVTKDLNYSNHFTDLDNAKYFAKLYGDRVRFDVSKGKWFIWAGHYWLEDNKCIIDSLIQKSIVHRQESARDIEDKDLRAATIKWAIQSENERHLTATLRIASKLDPIVTSGQEWDMQPHLFACRNGVLNLKDGSFASGVPSDMLSNHSPVAYDPLAQSVRFIEFMDQIFEGNGDLIYYIQKALGYSLTGMNSEQILFFCHGSGSNGKSVLFSTMEILLGTYAVSVPSATFLRNIMNTQTNDIAMMRNKRFVMTAETLTTTKMDEQKLKKISGGDSISARFLHKEFFTFQPICKIWLFLNHMPSFDDDSYGFWRRVRLIPFNKSFKGDAIDYDLLEKLKTELPGILNWLLTGAVLWYQEGLKEIPTIVTEATDEAKVSNNKLTDFVADCCIERADLSEKSSKLYAAYVKWANTNSYQHKDIMSMTAFGRLMTDNYKKIAAETGKFYQGLSLKPEYIVSLERHP